MKSFANLFLLWSLVLFSASCSTKEIRTDKQAQSFQLPDGSVVILNQKSSLTYDSSFSDRHVQLKGEAFFKVKKGDKPFTVSTATGQVTVLGTSFSVKEDDEQMEVEVETGEVEVKANDHVEKLKKGQRALVNDTKNLFEKGKAEFKHHIWTDDFKDDLKTVGNEVKKSGKKIGKEFQKLGRKIKKEIKD